MSYENKQKKRTVFIRGRFYDVTTLSENLPGNIILSMFRKPRSGERTPDGVLYKTDERAELSDYDMYIASFAVTVSILFNNPE